MKKILAILFATLLVVGTLFTLASCNQSDTTKKPDETTAPTPEDNPLAGTYNIVVWTSETAGVSAQVASQITKFCEANPGIVINPTIEGIGEGEAATQMITSVEDGADLFFFAQDQLSRLVQAAALNPLGVQTTATVKANNDTISVKASSIGDKIYAYPATSDNGYFMYYDKSVIDEAHLGSLEDLIADCEKAGRLFSFNLEGSGWYNASFFFATGCHSIWETDETGSFISVDDNFNSENGFIALKGMEKLLKSTAYHDSASAADFDAAVKSAVVVSGTWDSAIAKQILGDNYGVAELPSFTYNGKSYHLGSFSGNKLVGVKPQLDAKKAAVLQQLALYLTNKECQLERFESFGWGPSNLEAQASDAVKNDVTLAAFAKQNAYANPQLTIHGSWWDISKSYATATKEATSDDDIRAALTSYEKAINGLFTMPTDEKEAFTVIGAFDGHNWNADIEMSQKPEGTWYTNEPIAFKVGDEFKVRQGKSWDVDFGEGGFKGGNVKVEEDGNFYVKFVYDKVANTGVITLEKVNPNTGWTLIGTIAGSNWNEDFYMEPDEGGLWRTTEAYDMAAGTEFKVRQGLSWDVSYGNGTANFVVETEGRYYVEFNPETQVVSLVET